MNFRKRPAPPPLCGHPDCGLPAIVVFGFDYGMETRFGEEKLACTEHWHEVVRSLPGWVTGGLGWPPLAVTVQR